MARLGINWHEVSDLSKRTLENSEEFEDARSKYQETILSLEDCWKGLDARLFIINANKFLDYLKNDSDYLNEMGNFFKVGSTKYNSVVDEHENEMKKYNQDFGDDYHLNDGGNFFA